jgi:hypothetical protein
VTVPELVMGLLVVGVIIAILLPRFRTTTASMPVQVRVVQAPDSIVAPGSAATVTVMLTDSAGHGLTGARATFTVARGGGSVTPPAALADSGGRATATWRVGADTGANALTVTAPDRPGSTITISTVARPPAP